jgi:hypothetical protein
MIAVRFMDGEAVFTDVTDRGFPADLDAGRDDAGGRGLQFSFAKNSPARRCS